MIKKVVTKKLNVLMVENKADDAKQTKRVLLEGGLHLDYHRITTIDALRNALNNKNWDIILSDYSLPEINAETILSVLAALNQDVPLIILSSHVGEEAANTLMEMGAHDYVMKENMARLVPAIRRSLREVENFKCLDHIQAALQKSEARFRALTSNLPGVVFQYLLTEDGKTSFPYVSDGSTTLLGLSPQTLMNDSTSFPELMLNKDKQLYNQQMSESSRCLSTWNWEGCIHNSDDTDVKWVSLRATPRRTAISATLWDGIMINITRNKQAESEIAQSREQLAELSSYLQKVKEDERASIAREIHDDIGGTLTAIKCELVPCMDASPREASFYQAKAITIESLVDRVIDSTRRISLHLRPGILDCGIVAAVQWQTREFCSRAGVSCQVSNESDDIPLDPDLAVAIFRIFQEALTNISKHANATRIQVTLNEIDNLIFLEIIDDGCGITKLDMEKQTSFGIRGMRERCQQLKGSLHVTGIPGKGTKVTICIPINGVKNTTIAQPLIDSNTGTL